ncbi:hypothetical protein [Dokdonella sp.]|uniref:hypothetical protein n=1 Tax=Dokdonella sp. TaxID=2291710 RepID=UPI003BAE3A77
MPTTQDDCTDAGGTHPWMDAVERRREQPSGTAVESNAGAVAEQLQAMPAGCPATHANSALSVLQ